MLPLPVRDPSDHLPLQKQRKGKRRTDFPERLRKTIFKGKMLEGAEEKHRR